MITIYEIAQRYRSVGIDIPHPKPETIHTVKEEGISLPCITDNSSCPFGYRCSFCDGFAHVLRITDPAELNEYLVSSDSGLRGLACTKFEELQR